MQGGHRLWDAPVRLFHWAFATLVVFSWSTGHLGGSWMEWHLKSGYAVLALLVFRLAWGVAGSQSARFSRFLRGPAAVSAYLREAAAGRVAAVAGHNPAGGWMVATMIAVVALQAVTGLYADDEVATQGPLSALAPESVVRWMNRIHGWNEWVVAALVALHVAAIAWYALRFRIDLVGPMIHGRTANPAARELRFAPAWLAALLLALACGFVYWLVTIYPASPT